MIFTFRVFLVFRVPAFVWNCEYLNFEFVSNFGFRVSDLFFILVFLLFLASALLLFLFPAP